jgi:hypothetical protein
MWVISWLAENFWDERRFLESRGNKTVKVPELFQCVHSQNSKLFGDVTPYSLEDGYRRFGIGYPERLSAGFTEAFVHYAPNRMTKHHVGPWTWQSLENLTYGLSHFLTCYIWGYKNSTFLCLALSKFPPDDFILLGYDTASPGNRVSTFRCHVLPFI